MMTRRLKEFGCLMIITLAYLGCEDLTKGSRSIEESPEIRWFDLDVNHWVKTLADEDPLRHHRPTIDQCEGWWVEAGLLEVSTQACHYFSMSYTKELLGEASPIPIDSLLEQTLYIQGGVLHDFLTYRPLDGADQHATAHIALLVDQEVYWDQVIPLPSPSNYLPFELVIPPLFGERADNANIFTIHLHNHGANQWRWLPLKVGIRMP